MIGNSGSDKHAELIGSLGQSGKQSPHSNTLKPSPNWKKQKIRMQLPSDIIQQISMTVQRGNTVSIMDTL